MEKTFHGSFVLLASGLALAAWIWRKYSFQRAAQTFSMALFFSLFWLAAFEGRPSWPVELFLVSDPLLAAIAGLAGQMVRPLFFLSVIFILLAVFMGRVFCSHICPLGAFFDLGDRLVARPQKAKENRQNLRGWRKAKLAILFAVFGAALFGFQLLGLFDPLVVFTRFSACLFYPALLALQDAGLVLIRPVAGQLGLLELEYLEIVQPAFAGAVGFLVIMLGLVLLGRIQPRFWCRHLCPLGALLGLIGRFSPYRRRVSEKCTGCGRCVRLCPTGAIGEKGDTTDRSECIVCLRCVRQCPEKAVSFSFGQKRTEQDLAGVNPSRRLFLGGVASGVGAALAFKIDSTHPSESFLPLPFRHGRLIRPPGALPEPEFLARCVRCGECMRACLTNTIQPDWYRAGLEGLWAPCLDLRHAACEQTCNVCGRVCPTGAIRSLSLIEKQHAKIGTAVIIRDRCLPWSQDRRCLICDEQCPYNAIVFQHDSQHKVGLPLVNADRCNGCGQCEDKCPVLGEAAIIVVPQGELRLSSGSFVEEARARGLVFEGKKQFLDQYRLDDEDAPEEKENPDFSPQVEPKLPPGIEE